MDPFELLKSQIVELTDADPAALEPNTELIKLQLVSLDFVSIQVAVKKAYGFRMDLEELPKQNLVTVGDFAKYLTSLQHAQTQATVNGSPAPS